MKKPKWWPNNPYPKSIFTMTEDEYCNAILRNHYEHIRTRCSGFMARFVWDIASEAIYKAWKDNKETSEAKYNMVNIKER